MRRAAMRDEANPWPNILRFLAGGVVGFTLAGPGGWFIVAWVAATAMWLAAVVMEERAGAAS